MSQRSKDQELTEKFKAEKALDNDLLRNSDNGSNLSNNKTSKISEFDQMKLGGLKPKIDQK